MITYEEVCGNEIVGWGVISEKSDVNRMLTITFVEG
jgi:hypothetical protein